MVGDLKNRIRYTSTLPQELADRLKQLSIQTRIPQSKLLEEAIEDLLRKHEKTEQ